MQKKKKEKKYLFNLFGKLLLKIFDKPPHPLQKSTLKENFVSEKQRNNVFWEEKVIE